MLSLEQSYDSLCKSEHSLVVQSLDISCLFASPCFPPHSSHGSRSRSYQKRKFIPEMRLAGFCRVVLDLVVVRSRNFLMVGEGTQFRCLKEVVVKVKELAVLLLALSVEGSGTV
jgi:hypothetical protein